MFGFAARVLLLSFAVAMDPSLGKLYSGQYFDPRDFLNAECIVGKEYFYYGSRNVTAAVGNWTPMPCEKWSDVMAFHNQLFAVYNQFFFPEEYEEHNQCRWIPLDIYERHASVNMNNASAHHYVNTEGWRHGPWCYVKVADECERNGTVSCTSLWEGNFSSPYEPRPCFAPCNYSSIAERPTTDRHKEHIVFNERVTAEPKAHQKAERHHSNFNEKLIEHLNDQLFSSVSWGDMSYYAYLPSKQQLSASFIARRHYLLTTCVSIVVFILLLFFGTYAWRRMRARQRKQRPRVEETDVRTAIETDSVPQ